MNVYEIVKETLLEKMEAMNRGEVDGHWLKPWSLRKVRPMNWQSQRLYSGANLWLLDGFGSEFLTFKQIQELQKKNPEVKLRKGSKGRFVIFFKQHKINSVIMFICIVFIMNTINILFIVW